MKPLRCAAMPAAMAAALLAVCPPSQAADLGVRGATWAIAEPDLLDRIEARLADMERSGELARLEAQARDRVRAGLEAPDPVPGIAPARVERIRLFDPSIALGRDIVDADGRLIAAAGTRLDPLARHRLTRDLLFIDGRRAVEVDWALAHEGPAKIVLLAGRPLALARARARSFFFDQGGRLAARLGLAFTPSLVEQAGSKLRITEVPLAGESREASGDGWGTLP